jgi:CheY-like chemotaxis protein
MQKQIALTKGGFNRMQESKIVLYVYSNDRAPSLVSAILEKNGFVVLGVSDYEEALRCCRDFHFDLALLNCPLPGDSGNRLAQELKFARPEAPIIIISSGNISEHDLAFADAHFEAGTSLEDLLTIMHGLLSSTYLDRAEMPLTRHRADTT